MSDSDSTRQIWIVFWILLILTTVEVLLGIFQPAFMLSNYLVGVSLLNMTFIILTIVKAYYIVGTFMHLGHETKPLQISIIAPREDPFFLAAEIIFSQVFTIFLSGQKKSFFSIKLSSHFS